MTRPKKTNLSYNDISFRIPGLILICGGFFAEFELASNGIPPVTFTIGDKVIPAFFSLGIIGLIITMAPYIELAINRYREWKNSK